MPAMMRVLTRVLDRRIAIDSSASISSLIRITQAARSRRLTEGCRPGRSRHRGRAAMAHVDEGRQESGEGLDADVAQ